MTQSGATTAGSSTDDVAVLSPLIELRDVTRTFETEGGVRVEALRGVSLTICSGDFVAIRGPSGCGKSTLLNILGCLDRASGGTYRISDRDVAGLDSNELARLRRQTFGFVFQSYNLLPAATALENVEVPAVYAGTAQALRRNRAAQLLTSLGLDDRLDHRPSQLSGGEQQRVSIARALMNGGRIILADEPTGALDSRNSSEIISLLAGLAEEGHTVIVVTHDQAVAMQAHRQIEMLDGRVVDDSRTVPLTAPRLTDTDLNPPDGSAAAPLGEVIEAVRTALRSLSAKPFRTFLTLLGVVIGVAAVVALLAIGEGAKQRLAEEINALGADRLSVWADARAYPGAQLTPEDARAVADGIPNVKAVLPAISGTRTIRVGNRDHATTVFATSADFPLVRSWPVASGIFFDDADSEASNAVAVLGATVLDALFPGGENPLGRYVLIGRVPFLVIGTLTRKGATGFGNVDEDDVVVVPLQSGARRLFGRPSLRMMTVSVENSDLIDQTEDDVRALLTRRHGKDDIRIRNSAEMQETMTGAMSAATLVLGAIGSISLLVGGIGVMNIMLVTVTERTREIGLRVATGARRRDILTQFLIEAVVITCVGGLIGLVAGFGIGVLVSLIVPEVRVAFTLMPMVTALLCATTIGLIFGFAPARNAAALDPVVALSSD